jgi:hypothetical protein
MTLAAFETTVKVNTDPAIYTLGTRTAAIPLRQQVESVLKSTQGDICLDFEGTTVTQGYMDELLGVLILRHGPSILARVAFRSCSEDVKAVIQFVANTRGRDFKELNNGAGVS